MTNSDQLKQIRKRLARRFIMASEEMIAIAGPSNALFLDNLMSKQEWIEAEGWTLEGGWFYRTLEAQQSDTGLGLRTLRRAKRFFQERGVLQTCRSGAPPKEYYRINGDVLGALLGESSIKEFGGANPCEVQPLSLRSARISPCEVQGITNKNRNNKNIRLSKDNQTALRQQHEQTSHPSSESNRSTPMQSNNPSPVTPQRVHPRVDEIIGAWNTLPGVARVRVSDPPTKTLIRAQGLLTNLLRGKPLVWHMQGESMAKLERFMDREKINGGLSKRKWKADEIVNILRAAVEHDLCPPGRPALGQVLFNGFSQGKSNRGHSLFLVVANEREVEAPYRERAQRLAEVVHALFDLKSTDREVASWASDVRKLVQDHGVRLPRVDTALAWYSKHGREQFVPAIHSGRDLLNKFAGLEQAMKRGDAQREADVPRRMRGMRAGPEHWKRAGG